MIKKNLICMLFVFFLITAIFSDGKEKKILIEVKPGLNYSHNYWFLKCIPQIAIWAEDTNGNFIDTIYVTYRAAKSEWIGGTNIRRPSALPIWSHKRGAIYKDGLYMPTIDEPLPDSVTGATPVKLFIKEFIIPSNYNKKDIIIKVEVNKSFDFNNVYKENLPKDSKFYNDVNGQPSVLYEAKFDLTKTNNRIKLEIVGHGDVMGINGNIDKDLSFLTDSVNIMDSINVSIKE